MRRTLVEELVVLATQLCPPGKFILAACSVQVPSDFEVIGLDLALLAGCLRRRDREEVDQSPELLRSAAVARVWARLHVTHQIVDCGGSNRVDKVDDNLDNEDAEHKRGHLFESGEASEELVEIELLGKSHVPDPNSVILRDDNAVAISKIRLVQAFIVAQKLFKRLHATDQGTSQNELLRSTAVILLMDPEHLTAANMRKRLITSKLDDKNIEDMLQFEKHLVDSLLTSRLHRHTKSPTLWNHRRWLMEQFRLQGRTVTVEDDLTRIIMISGERHPRNYYAWCHARYLIKTFILPSSSAEEALSRIITRTQKWCFAHHNDISGWQFLIFLLEKQPNETSSVFRETLKLTGSFKWRNESVWYFLRYVAARKATITDRDEFENLRRILWESIADGDIERRTLERAEQWLMASQETVTGS
ncbi:hypothetical protein HG530_001018 [Fusarium avenaceum]|nr:hypothetical protein HG530_001018 [Fusarium avenaceum]